MKIILYVCLFLLIAFFSFSIFCIYKLKRLRSLLEAAKLHNQTLQNLYDNIRTFKHDFFNIMQSIDGYIKTGNTSALNSYYKEIKFECDNLNNLSALNSSFIDDSAIYNLIMAKYSSAITAGISVDINFLVKLSTLNINPYTLSRILGILLDNAIEAASISNEKQIILEVVPVPSFDNSKQMANIIIENSYADKNIDLDRICEKGFTSKSTASRFSWSWSMECIKNFEEI